MSYHRWGGILLAREVLRLLLVGEVPGFEGVNAIVGKIRDALGVTAVGLPDIARVYDEAPPRSAAQITEYPAVWLYGAREQPRDDRVPFLECTVEVAIWVADTKLDGTVSAIDAVGHYTRALRDCIDQAAGLPGRPGPRPQHSSIPDTVQATMLQGMEFPDAAGDLDDHNAIALGEATVLLLRRMEF